MTLLTSPRWMKGAIVEIDLEHQWALPAVITLQYNPETLTRSLAPRAPSREGQGHAQSLGFSGAPEETFTVNTVISAGFEAEGAAGKAGSMGIMHLLAALEILLYPGSSQVKTNQELLDDGKVAIGGGAYNAPLTLFVWGRARILPVTITNVTVREQAFDASLNPTHAEVDITMKALSYSDLDSEHKGYELYLTYQMGKELLALQGRLSSLTSLVGF